MLLDILYNTVYLNQWWCWKLAERCRHMLAAGICWVVLS